eukprot:Nk52_evm5s2635 gene=Nk52_evmTU5s2635
MEEAEPSPSVVKTVGNLRRDSMTNNRQSFVIKDSDEELSKTIRGSGAARESIVAEKNQASVTYSICSQLATELENLQTVGDDIAEEGGKGEGGDVNGSEVANFSGFTPTPVESTASQETVFTLSDQPNTSKGNSKIDVDSAIDSNTETDQDVELAQEKTDGPGNLGKAKKAIFDMPSTGAPARRSLALNSSLLSFQNAVNGVEVVDSTRSSFYHGADPVQVRPSVFDRSGSFLQNVDDIVRIGYYDVGEKLGQGQYSTVKKAKHIKTGQHVAIKIIDKLKLDEKAVTMFLREFDILKTLDHPNIVRLFEVMETPAQICLIMQYCSGGDMLDYILSQQGAKRLREEEARKFAKQILVALEYIHGHGVVHRDIKAENFILDDDGHLKLTDFGFSNRYHRGKLMSTYCGSPTYAAPEIHRRKPYSGWRSDIWSTGVLIYVMVTGSFPFIGDNMTHNICTANYSKPCNVSNECRSLINEMLQPNPAKRKRAVDYLQHKWFRDTDNVDEVSLQVKINNWNNTMDRMKTKLAGQAKNTIVIYESVLKRLELYGFEREDILKSIGNRYFDSKSGIYHLLLDAMTDNERSDLDNMNIHSYIEDDSTVKQDLPSNVLCGDNAASRINHVSELKKSKFCSII